MEPIPHDITIIIPVRHTEYSRYAERSDANCLYIDDCGNGKKWALYDGVSKATTEFVWLRDADVEVIEPLSEMDYKHYDMCILPLRMTVGKGSLIEKMQQIEYALIQYITLKSAWHGRAVMCSGANLIVRRDAWLQSFNDLHTEIPSGDDMFLLESMKSRKRKITAFAHPMAQIEPLCSLKDLLNQRARWAGKANKYIDKDICVFGALTAIFLILSILCPLVWLLGMIWVFFVLSKTKQLKLIGDYSLFVTFILLLLYPWYALLSVLMGLFRQNKW